MSQDFLSEFVYTYFLGPIASNGWFNPINTIVYSVILIAAVFLVFKLLKKFNIRIDFRFFIAILPFIVWGSSTRVLHDAAVAGVLAPEQNAFYGSLIFPTPGSYIITFLLAFTIFLISLGIQKLGEILKIKNSRYFPEYWRVMFVVGMVLVINNFLLYPVFNLVPALLIIGLTILWSAIFFGISKLFQSNWFKSSLFFQKEKSNPLTQAKPVSIYNQLPKRNDIANILTPANQGILASHFLDASATFIALSYFGYLEQHVIPRLLIPLFGPISMFALKIVVVIPVLYVIDRYSDSPDFKNFLKIVVLILGLAPGLRDLIRLAVGV